jgi:hypothetical protein
MGSPLFDALFDGDELHYPDTRMVATNFSMAHELYNLYDDLCSGELFVKIRTYIVSSLSSNPSQRKERINAVRALVFTRRHFVMPVGHPHPICASTRIEASRFIGEIVDTLNRFNPKQCARWDISIAPREEKMGAVGSRLYYTAKDAAFLPKYGTPNKSDIVTMVDTDYYLRGSDLSRYAGRDIVMYSLTPNALAGLGPENYWRFVSEDVVKESVNGGADYLHHIWNWNVDFVFIPGPSWLRPVTYMYEVVRHQIDEARSVTVLLKTREFYMPLRLLDWLVPGVAKHTPQRMSVQRSGDYLVGTFGTPGNMEINLLPVVGTDILPTKVRPQEWLTLGIMSKSMNADLKKCVLLPSDVNGLCSALKLKWGDHDKYRLSSYFSTTAFVVPSLTYQTDVGLYTTPREEIAFQVAPALVPPAVANAGGPEDKVAALEKRVEETKNVTQFDGGMIEFAREFVDCIVPAKLRGRLVPDAPEEIRARQNRPEQRNRRLKTVKQLQGNPKPVAKSNAFIKREANVQPGDPRVINTVTSDHQMTLSQFMYPVSRYMKRHHGKWFAVGKTPRDLGRTIQNSYKHLGPLTGGDYSRMDGRMSVDYRVHVFERLVRALFQQDHHEIVMAYLASERNAEIRMRGIGKRVKTEGANLSGSPNTTLLNTICAAFNEYAARRLAGQTKLEAFSKLGVYYGDDSLFGADVSTQIVEVANKLGMKMKLETNPDGSPAGRCVFLARVYPDISMTTVSYPDLRRILAKLCVSTNPRAKTVKGQKLMASLKGEASLLINEHVPIVGPLSRLMRDNVQVKQKERDVAIQTDKDLRYLFTLKNKVDLSPTEENLLYDSIARDLGKTVSEVRLFHDTLMGAKDLTEVCGLKLASDKHILPQWQRWVPSLTAESKQ